MENKTTARLRRRIESYRRRQSDCMPRFDQTFTGLCEQNIQDTLQLKQRYLDAKNKRTPKNKDKKQQDSAALQSSVHVQQKFLKRSAEEHEPGGPSDAFEPPVKLQCTTQHGGAHQPEGLTKFSVEIVQQLEFTTSAANSQPQQISTNVTVKALTNASVKSDVSSPKSSNPSTPASNLRPNSGVGNNVDIGNLVECVKQEPDNDFADLDQCAAALEKDAAVNGGSGFGGFSDLIGEDTNDEIITPDAFNDLISDISNYPEFMKDFDFDESKTDTSLINGLKVEDNKDIIQQNIIDNTKNVQNTQSPLLQNQNNYSPPVFEGQGSMAKSRLPYSNIDFGKTELSPAAQTLKQMAEQHQHKNQMGLSFNTGGRVPNSRSPYPDFQFQGDYGSPTSNPNFKNSQNFPQPDMIKQEMMYQNSEYDMKRKGAGMYKQQYSPYGSPSASSHGSPGYLPRGNGGGNATPGAGAFGGGTPPRPSSGPGGNNSGTTLQINQAQQLHISQQGQGHAIQVSAGQHLQLSGDLKGNVSIATQQGMYFNQQQSQNNNMGPNPQQNPSSQQQNPSANNQGVPQQQNPLNQHQSSGMGPQQAQQSQSMHQSGAHISNNQLSNSQNASQQHAQTPYGNLSANDLHGNAMTANGGMMGAGNMGGGLPSMTGHGVGGNQHQVGMGNDMYSMSQTQTINFTQQSLRRVNAPPTAMPNNMGPNGSMNTNVGMGPGVPLGSGGAMGGGPMVNPMGSRHMTPQALEQQKLLQQQQMLRAQQALMQQHIVRPPPPEYKASTGMMQGMQPRYPTAPPTTRRMPQTMPPSGPMMRSHNMYVMQQQHMGARNMYPRQQGSMGGNETMPQHGSAEWRHLLVSQHQNANFNSQMRPNFQHQGSGFGMNTGNMQMTGLQHQQMRVQQQGMVPSGLSGQGMGQSMGQPQSMGQAPMQMNNLNQQMISHMQQQQAMIQQQNSNQMSMASMNMQQSQSMAVNNQALQQQLNNHQQQQLLNNTTNNNQSNSLANFNPQAADFNLDFLESLPTTDTSGFTDQELLNSFDNDSGFLHDIL